jgi:uncharacterized protein YhaN
MKPITIEELADRLSVAEFLKIAQLAIDLVTAEQRARQAKFRYIDKIQEFEKKHGAIEHRLSMHKPEHAKARAYTDDAYLAYRYAKDQAYNVKRRLDTAVRRHQGGC